MRKAETLIYDSSHCAFECAETLMNLFSDKKVAEMNLALAEKLSSTSVYGSIELTNCANSWGKLFDNANKVSEILSKAEILADSSYCWSYIAETWIMHCQEYDKAKDCVLHAESLAELVRDWLGCSKVWSVLKKPKVALRCMAKVEKTSVLSLKFIECAECWSKYLYSEDEAKRCILAGEEIASDFDDWLDCAEVWMRIFKNEKEARRCISIGNERTSGFSSYLTTIDEWWHMFNKCEDQNEKI